MKYLVFVVCVFAFASTVGESCEEHYHHHHHHHHHRHRCHRNLNCLETYMVMHVSLQPSIVQDWINYTRECAEENNVGPEICEGLLKRNYSNCQNEACFFSCFAEKIKVVLADRNNLTAIKTSMTDMQFQKANQCLAQYSKPTTNETERCWNVYKTHQCYMTSVDEPDESCEDGSSSHEHSTHKPSSQKTTTKISTTKKYPKTMLA